MEAEKPHEIRRKSLASKDVYHFVDAKNEIDVKSKEVFKGGKKVTHFPFIKGTGKPKYRSVRSITYDGMGDNISRGFLKSSNTGYGFTKVLSPIIYFLEEKFPNVGEIVISLDRPSEIQKKKAILRLADLNAAYDKIDPLLKQHKEETIFLVGNIFSDWFPNDIERTSRKYSKGQLARILSEHSVSADSLSTVDVEALLNLISSFPDSITPATKKRLVSAKDAIDLVYIESILYELDGLISQKTDSDALEERWHKFFRDNAWLLCQLFAFPMVYFKDKMFVGGKDSSNEGGKIADFIYRSEFSDNIAIIEIKTHLTQLVAAAAYRGDDVFPISRQLSGAINQTLDQRDNLQKEFYIVRKNSDYQSFNPKCLVLVGNHSNLKANQVKSFELFRNSQKDIEIVTFDELRKKIESLLSIFKNENLDLTS